MKERAAKKKFTNCPAWLRISDDKTSLIYVPEKAKVVRRIFELSIAGFGGYTIAKRLNSENVPGFGPGPNWDQSTIHNMLRNRATIGEYQPGRRPGKGPPHDPPIANYYPAVIEESIFNAAQKARQQNLVSGRGRKGRLITNLFARLVKCSYCAADVKLHSNGKGNSLVCATALKGDGCHRFRWTLSDFEQCFFDCLKDREVDPKLSKILADLSAAAEAQFEVEIYRARAEMVQILKATVSKIDMSSAGNSPPSRDPKSDIRRDHPNRMFTIEFLDGSSQTGRPAVVQTRTARVHSALALSRALHLTARQGALTALLADGETLIKAAEELGIGFETARWHLRVIFKRTNTKSQNQLTTLAKTVMGFGGGASSTG